MSLTGVDTTIKTAYEVDNASPEEIAESEGFAVEAVKAKLMQVSSKYRKDCGKEDESESLLNFTNEEAMEAKRVIFETAIAAEDEHLRFKAALMVYDEKKGRREIVKQIQNAPQFNLLQVNSFFERAREGAKKMKESVINIASQPSTKELIEA